MFFAGQTLGIAPSLQKCYTQHCLFSIAVRAYISIVIALARRKTTSCDARGSNVYVYMRCAVGKAERGWFPIPPRCVGSVRAAASDELELCLWGTRGKYAHIKKSFLCMLAAIESACRPSAPSRDVDATCRRSRQSTLVYSRTRHGRRRCYVMGESVCVR